MQSVSTRARSIGTIVRDRFPFTLRGLVLVAFAAIIFLGPVMGDSDIVAAVLCASLAGGLLFLLVLRTLQARLLRKSFAAALSPAQDKLLSTTLHALAGLYNASSDSAGIIRESQLSPDGTELDESQAIFAERPIRVVVHTTPLRVFPLFQLVVELSLEPRGLEGELRLMQILTGSLKTPREIPFSFRFPHRGHWSVRAFTFRVHDVLGITRAVVRLAQWDGPHQFTVLPEPRAFEQLPLVSSATREGDLYTDQHTHSGDPYDIKRYHPADGMRRVVWKIFAKSGQLMSRHPEAAIAPEGQAVVCCTADWAGDHVAAVCISYLGELLNLGIECYLASPHRSLEEPVTSTTQAALFLSEDIAEFTVAEAQQTIVDLVAMLRERRHSTNLRSVALFLSQEALSDQEGAETLLAVIRSLEDMAVVPTLMIVANGEIDLPSQHWIRLDQGLEEESGVLDHLSRLFLAPVPGAPPPSADYIFRTVLEMVAGARWPVLRCTAVRRLD